jgi:hypothetical protein
MENAEQHIKQELELFEQEQMKVATLAEELQANPKFAQFLEAQKNFRQLEATIWGNIEQAMLDNNIKSIKTEKITLSIAERTSFDVDPETLPAKFWKKTPDTTKIGKFYKLEGNPVKGTTPRVTRYLVKRIK